MSTVEPSTGGSLVPSTPPQVPANIPKRRGRPPKQRPPEQPPAATEPEEPAEFTVVARDHGEMQAAQTKLIAWAQRRHDAIETEASELDQNFRAAQVARIGTRAIERQLGKLKKQAEFYDKIRLALEAGYTLIPDMEAQVFAVRTRRRYVGGLRHVPAENLPAGEGRYVAPETAGHVAENTYRDNSGQTRTHKFWFATSFIEELDFPFSLAAYEVVDATKRALLEKVFDQLAAVTPRNKGGDPMVIGRIRRPGFGPWERRCATFLVAWFVDTRFLWR